MLNSLFLLDKTDTVEIKDVLFSSDAFHLSMNISKNEKHADFSNLTNN